MWKLPRCKCLAMNIEELAQVIRKLPTTLCKELTEKMDAETEEKSNSVIEKYPEQKPSASELAKQASLPDIQEMIMQLIERTLTE